MQHHYLPKSAYLRFFEVPNRPGYVYFYQRQKDIVLASLHNVAKERHLYSFTDKAGKVNSELDRQLGTLEQQAGPVLEKLGHATASFHITVDEFNRLMSFISLQAVRTPTFRKTLEQMTAQLRLSLMKTYAQDKDVFSATMKKVRAARSEEPFPDISDEELRTFILDDSKYTIEAKGDYFLGLQMEMQDRAFRAIVLKQITVCISEKEEFITSDHPVCLVPHPGAPRGGFLYSDVMCPIARRACLGLIASPNPRPITDRNQRIPVMIMEGTPTQVRETNKMTMAHAENYLFAAAKNEKIRALFDRTSAPTRFQVSSPLSRRKA